ncbi:MAG: hypothetical protein MZV65_47175 [Chromatiales bacterium]|nr:hypothetical protein [Chromatiales bacterium]
MIKLALTVATWTSIVALAAVFGELLMGALPAFSSINIIGFFTGTVVNETLHPHVSRYRDDAAARRDHDGVLRCGARRHSYRSGLFDVDLAELARVPAREGGVQAGH